MVNLLRIWLPFSLAAHGIVFALLVLIPPSNNSLTEEKLETPMKISMVAITPTKLLQPLVVKAISRLRVLPVQNPTPSTKKQIEFAREVKAVDAAKIAPSLPVKANTTPTGIDNHRLTSALPGQPSSSLGKLPEFASPVNNSRPKGWGDSPAAGQGINPIGVEGPERGGRSGSSSPFNGISGTAVALRPGSSPSMPGAAGGSAGSYGGIGQPTIGMPTSSGGLLAGMGATIITSSSSAGNGWHNQPGTPGGAGIGIGGMMPSGPTRPGMPGSTISGSTGNAIGPRPGGMPTSGDLPINYGGITGIPGIPVIGGGSAGIPVAVTAGGSTKPAPGADQPGNTGNNGDGVDVNGPRSDKPSYAAAAVSGPLPSYPRVARTENVTGTVLLEVFIDAAGNVIRVAILQRSPSDILDNEAKKKLSQWQYRPAMKDGKVTTGSVMFSVTYSADSEPVTKEIK